MIVKIDVNIWVSFYFLLFIVQKEQWHSNAKVIIHNMLYKVITILANNLTSFDYLIDSLLLNYLLSDS